VPTLSRVDFIAEFKTIKAKDNPDGRVADKGLSTSAQIPRARFAHLIAAGPSPFVRQPGQDYGST
jgi:hypothetical protein